MLDARPPTLTTDLTVAQAIDRLRAAASVDDEVYVITREQDLAGVVPTRVLVVSAPAAHVDVVMQQAAHRVSPGMDVKVVHMHPGWAHTRTLPVVAEGARAWSRT